MRNPPPLMAPSLILLAGITATLLAGMSGVSTLTAVIGLLATGGAILLLCRRTQRTHAVIAEAPAASSEKLLPGIDELCEQTLPLWSQQIESARSHTEDAISALSERFSHLSGRIQQSLGNGSEREAGNRLVALLSTSQHELDMIIMALREALASKESLLKEVMELSGFTDQLQEMAQDVANIA